MENPIIIDTIPEKIINIETISKSLYEIFVKNKDNKPLYFDSGLDYENNDNLKYKIPPHQRHGVKDWNLEKKQKLIDSIYKGYPIQGITTSKHIKNIDGNIFECQEIEDGATRLTILQEYYNDNFRYCNKYFSEIESRHQQTFNNYKINIDIMNDASPEDITHAFERLNNGKPLNDSDRYYAMKDVSPLVIKSIEITKTSYWNPIIMKTKDFSSKKRKILPELCAIVATIAFGKEYTSVSSKRLFKLYYEKLPQDIDKKLESFFNLYNNIYNKSLEIKQTTNGNIDWHKTSKFLGLIMHDYLDLPDSPNKKDIKDKEDMWIYIIKLIKTVPNFWFGDETVWSGNFTKAQKRNCLAVDFSARLNRLREIYDIRTRANIVKKNNIVIV